MTAEDIIIHPLAQQLQYTILLLRRINLGEPQFSVLLHAQSLGINDERAPSAVIQPCLQLLYQCLVILPPEG